MVDQTVYIRSQVGRLDLENIEQVTDTEITCLLKTRTVGRGVRVSLRVEADEPHNIADIRLAPAGGPSARTAPVTRMDEAGVMVALREELEKRMASDQFSGAVLVAKNGKPIFEQAYGRADRDHKTPNTLDTKFRLGSMNKLFTAVAVVQLPES